MLASLMMVAAVAGAVGQSAPATQSNNWEADYGKALKQSRTDDRPLLVVIDNPSESSEAVAPELLKDGSADKYDRCRVDVSTAYGEKVAEAFGADSFPYLAILDKDGKKIIHQHEGQLTDSQWRETLEKHKQGIERRVVMKPATSSQVIYETQPPVMNATPNYTAPVHYSAPAPTCLRCQRGY